MEKLGSRFRLAPSFTLLCVAAAAVVVAASCSSGTPSLPCSPPDSPACTEGCDPDEKACGGECVDIATSAEHCGECDNACGDGRICVDGECVRGSDTVCKDGLVACGDDCVNLALSAEHCGECDNACDDGQACIDGGCVDAPACEDGLIRCGEDCVDTDTDEQHCSGCGEACDDGETCVNGTCSEQCDDGFTKCAGACVDLETDVQHCGSCGEECEGGQDCVEGACEDVPCGDGLTRCGVACVDLDTNAQHCGGCGDACDAGQLCVGGACEVDECVESGGTRCDGACVNTMTDARHCGGCRQTCGAAQVCQAGRCACTVAADRDIGNVVPRSVTGTTVGGTSVYTPSCVPASANEHVISFTAPSAGVYSFDASKSEYEVVIAVIDAGGCAELACSAEPGAAAVKVSLATNQTVLIVVDGANGATGAFVVDVTRESAPVCPAGAFGLEVPSHITGSTIGRPNSVRPTETDACPTGIASDAGYTFAAPVAGDYTFDTFGSDFDTLLHVHAGRVCNGQQIACNDDYQGSEQSSVTVTLAAGEEVVVVVDGAMGAAGQFVLNVNRAVPLPVCDNTGFCGDSTEGCVRCAFDGNCRKFVDACVLERDCLLFLDCSAVDCHGSNNRDACVAACAGEHPRGAEMAEDMYTCAYCNECRNDCSDADFTCP